MLKNKAIRIIFIFCTIIFVFGLIYLYWPFGSRQVVEEEDQIVDLTEIKKRGVIRATTNYNSTNYFIYRGQPMGFHLELLKLFANNIGVELEVFVSNDLEENFACLIDSYECDVIALDLTVTRSRSQLFNFTEPHSKTRQVLVQRLPDSWYSMHSSQIEDELIRNQLDLAGKTIHVQRKSAYVTRLQHLMEEIGDTIYVVEVDKEVETLIEKVANGEIDYTISDENLAQVNENYYANIDAKTPISFHQNLAWAVRNDADELLEAINSWMHDFRQTRQYVSLYNKYFKNPRSAYIAKSPFNTLRGGNISAYDDYFKEYSEQNDWDWRLVASLAYQESRFDHTAVSWAGAFGIMQLMPRTAAKYNVYRNSPVIENISAGISYLNLLDNRFKRFIEDDEERLKFVLAAYNVGIGHVLDARRLAEKHDKDPNVWKNNVDYFILNKSKAKYYNDPVVHYGYARGHEPYHYVIEVLERYEHYKNVLDG